MSLLSVLRYNKRYRGRYSTVRPVPRYNLYLFCTGRQFVVVRRMLLTLGSVHKLGISIQNGVPFHVDLCIHRPTGV